MGYIVRCPFCESDATGKDIDKRSKKKDVNGLFQCEVGHQFIIMYLNKGDKGIYCIEVDITKDLKRINYEKE